MAAPISSRSYAVEYFGGPLDGRIERRLSPPRPFVACILRVGRRGSLLHRLLAAVGCVKSVPLRSAIYVLDDEGCRYRFLRTQFMTDACELGEAVQLIEAKG
jgi:hypothetical protein